MVPLGRCGTRRIRARFLEAIARWRHGRGYRIPAEFVVATGRAPDARPRAQEARATSSGLTIRDIDSAEAGTFGQLLAGGVVYFGDMAHYGSGGLATQARNGAGVRLLAVEPSLRSRGAGRALTQACIDLARRQGKGQVILHTTRAMKVAWEMYERLGFVRSGELDFSQHGLPVFGFRLILGSGKT